ncbi:thermosome subunit, partial [Candidatus Woesearchaeota archaeon]|nr:thermosome subunit [Candidatus Woesearchaeota archaeon]
KSLKEMTLKISECGVNVVFCEKGIDDTAQYYLAKAGILACRRIPKEDMEKLARATSGKIISNLSEISDRELGNAQSVRELKKEEDSLIYVEGCINPRAVTLVLRGGTEHVVDEVERAVKDGLGDVISALKSGKVVAGGGAIEIELSRRLRAFAKTLGGREQLAVEEFANSLECIPEALAENAGLDPIDILTELKQRHEAGSQRDGLNLFSNRIEDVFSVGIVEPLKVKTQAISSASEVAMMILRIDDVLTSENSGQGGMPSRVPQGYEGMD